MLGQTERGQFLLSPSASPPPLRSSSFLRLHVPPAPGSGRDGGVTGGNRASAPVAWPWSTQPLGDAHVPAPPPLGAVVRWPLRPRARTWPPSAGGSELSASLRLLPPPGAQAKAHTFRPAAAWVTEIPVKKSAGLGRCPRSRQTGNKLLELQGQSPCGNKCVCHPANVTGDTSPVVPRLWTARGQADKQCPPWASGADGRSRSHPLASATEAVTPAPARSGALSAESSRR